MKCDEQGPTRPQISPPSIPGPRQAFALGRLGRRILLIVAILVPITVAILAGIGQFFLKRHIGAWGKVDAQIAELQERGEPTDPSDLNGPPVPDAENAAVALEQAMRVFVTDGGRDLWSGLDSADAASWPARKVEAVEEWLSENEEALRLVREAARCPNCRFAEEYTLWSLPRRTHRWWLRCGARLLRGSASVNIVQDNFQAAAQDVAEMLALGRHFDREPMLVGRVGQFAVYSLALKPVRALLHEPGVSTDVLSALDAALTPACRMSSLRIAAVGERAMGLRMFRQFREEDEAVKRGELPRPPSGTYPAWLLAADELFFLERMEQIAALCDQPFYQSAAAIHKWQLETRTRASDFPPKTLSGILISDFEQVSQRYAECQAQLTVARTAVAVRRYHARTGSLPTMIEDLVPQELDQLPVDPRSGAWLQYRGSPGAKTFAISAPGSDPNLTEIVAEGVVP